MESRSWADLPEDILVSVFSYLSLTERYRAGLVCKSWCHSFDSPILWHSMTFTFTEAEEFKYELCFENYGQYLRSVEIYCDQSVTINRENACRLIDALSNTKKRRLEKLAVLFLGENPLFYNGKEFIQSLKRLFGPVPEGIRVILGLKSINLSRLPIAFEDELFQCLADNNHEQLEVLNIQNASLVCKVTPVCIKKLVQKCRKLKFLATHYSNITEEALMTLIELEDGRTPLEYLSILCRREDRYCKDIPCGVWYLLKTRLPGLKVTLIFDHSCPMFKVDAILNREVPLSNLRLEVQAWLVDQVYFAAEYYSETLERLTLSTTNSPELETALIHLASTCPKLRELHVFQCYISENTRREVLELRQLDKYFLKSKG